jgi:PIN domain nuclease of toxin-antitoxin system
LNLLLDTHILLWWLADDRQLSEAARELITNPENAIFVSAVTMWEIWLKHSLGKLQIPEDFEQALDQEGFESLPLTAAHARRVDTLDWHHRDPFDRMLIAQAQVAGMTLLTADGLLSAYGEAVLLAK